MRHAKSDWDAGARSDHARPLNRRGVDGARTMGRLISAIGEHPDLVLTSSAVRAATTAELAAESGGWDCEIRPTDALYDAYPDSVIQLLDGVPDPVERLMIVGHQPTWSGVVHRLTGGSVSMRTATVAIVDLMLGSSWAHGGDLSGELVAVLQPRHFEDLRLG
jgi:phosphohistidine phosphatase